ncbi:cephalosporin-C deacetylase [Dactylosporangium siamense]|uniref:Cephalosporin-C deacetylase n=1 Tax=Dactylosporangium siamense TaxID=685454 RepID=A0A919PMN5_9ACTN|nr:cephalosporin-C deacetylase [Dactylosporangium siamense]
MRRAALVLELPAQDICTAEVAMFTEMPVSELSQYRPDLAVPDDLDRFWQTTLAEVAEHPLDVVAEPVRDTPLRSVIVYDVTFSGFGGHRISAWYLVPRQLDRPAPTVIEYIGYGGGRGLPQEWLFWSAAGYPHLIMDTRGQGSAWRSGDTVDGGSAGLPHVPGFLTDGLPDRDRYYYRRLFADAVRAVDAATELPFCDPDRLVTTGISQGGALALAAASLHPNVARTMPSVPFLCNIKRSAQVATLGPYRELVQWCEVQHTKVDAAFATLAYFDLAILARSARCPALFGISLRDEKCPPSGGYACFNQYGGPKQMLAYEWNGHEGGEAFRLGHQADWLAAWLA